MNNNKSEKRANSTNENNKDNNAARMNKNEQVVLRGIIRKSVTAMIIIMTVISKNLPAVIRWIKQLKSCNEKQQLTLKSLFATAIGEATLMGMPTAVRNMLEGMGAPRSIVALTSNRKVEWLLNYVMDTYSLTPVNEVLFVAGQAAALGATIEEEVEKRSYLSLYKPDEMSEEEVKNL